jgi:hypothetical protein
MLVQEMKQGVLDFATVQMGLDEETLNGRCSIYSGDGKTFDQLLKLKKYLAAEEGDFDSFCWIVPLLELWPTKWTDLSRVVHTHRGKDFPDNPSTLGCATKLAECPTPSDLRKVDFYDGAHIVNLTLDAHFLNTWEVYYQTTDLVHFFELRKEMDNLRNFNSTNSCTKTHNYTSCKHIRELVILKKTTQMKYLWVLRGFPVRMMWR